MSIKVMNFIWDHYPEGGSELLLILALADHADDVGDRIYPSVQTMARKTRMSERTVQYLLRRIQERGWLVLVEAGGGRKRTARYRINMGRTGNGANIAPIAKGCNPKQERVQTSAETVQKNTVNGATAIAPEPPVEPSVTTTTTTPVVVGEVLEWPTLPPEHRKVAVGYLAKCPTDLQQQVLDEWAALIMFGKVKAPTPLPYLRRLVELAVDGTFTPEAGIAVSARRKNGSGDDAYKQRLAASKLAFESQMAAPGAGKGTP